MRMSRYLHSRVFCIHSSGRTLLITHSCGERIFFPMTLSPCFTDGGVIVRGTVVHGFGRGSKTLGFPTANIHSPNAKVFANTYPTGIYAGWARVMLGPDSLVYPAAISVGWNPT